MSFCPIWVSQSVFPGRFVLDFVICQKHDEYQFSDPVELPCARLQNVQNIQIVMFSLETQHTYIINHCRSLEIILVHLSSLEIVIDHFRAFKIIFVIHCLVMILGHSGYFPNSHLPLGLSGYETTFPRKCTQKPRSAGYALI